MKTKILKCLKIITYFCAQLILSNLKFVGNIKPAGISFAFAGLLFGENLLLVSLSYFLSQIIFSSTISSILVVFYETIILSMFYFVREIIKTNKLFLILILSIVVSHSLSLYFSLSSLSVLIYNLIELFAKLIFTLYFCLFVKTYQKKKIFSKLTIQDYAIVYVMIFLISLSIFSISFCQYEVFLFVFSLTVIFLLKIVSVKKTILAVFMILLAYGLSAEFTSKIGSVLILCLCLILLKDLTKVAYFLLNLFVFIVYLYILNDFTVKFAFFVLVPNLIYLCVPSRLIEKFKLYFEDDNDGQIQMLVSDKNYQEIQNKLELMSKTFLEMKNDFKYLLVGKIDRNIACQELSKDVVTKFCNSCPKYLTCFSSNINKRQIFQDLLFKSIENKGLNFDDLTFGALSYCDQINSVSAFLEKTSKDYLGYENAMKNEDSSKLVIASEIGNFSDIFKNFAKMLKNKEKINKNASFLVKNALTAKMINIKEVAVVESQNCIEYIGVLAPNEVLVKTELVDVFKKTLKINFSLESVKHLDVSGLSFASFKPSSPLQVQFEVKSIAKSDVNGDNSVVSKLSNGKYFVAICDGMGHGEKANKISKMILNLIKSMFEIGIDNSLIVESVNKLLIPAGIDNFSTLDAAVIDTFSQTCTFVKLGSSVSIIKHQNTSEVVSCNSLPIGIVQNISPTIVSKTITAGDKIFLASDGVVDSFSSVENFKCFINDAKIFNFEKYVDDLAFDISNLNHEHKDDITLIGINLLKK